jgi:hypothetical protein
MRKKDAVSKALEHVRQQTRESTCELEQLRAAVESNKAKSEQGEIDLKALEADLARLKDTYTQKKKEVSAEANVARDLRQKIAKLEQSNRMNEGEANRLQTEQKALEDTQAKVARQSELLDLKSREFTTLVLHTHANYDFMEKLERLEQRTATISMRRYVKAEIFDKLTDLTDGDLVLLAKNILAARNKEPRKIAAKPALKRLKKAPKALSVSDAGYHQPPGSADKGTAYKKKPFIPPSELDDILRKIDYSPVKSTKDAAYEKPFIPPAELTDILHKLDGSLVESTKGS